MLPSSVTNFITIAEFN